MKTRNRSRTAESAAAMRAIHLAVMAPPYIFEDPYAHLLTSPGWRLICRSRLLFIIGTRILYQGMLPILFQILARGRFAEDQLEKAATAGIDQYVILGAGLDSFAIRRRDLAENLRIFELDHPASQDSKKQRLKTLKIDIPENLEFVNVDFEIQSLEDALLNSSYSSARPAFFSWLGSLHYIAEPAVFKTLAGISKVAAPGSELVCDYAVTEDHAASEEEKAMFRKLKRFTARRGEPLLSMFDPSTFPDKVCELGFELIQNISPRVQTEMYLANRQDHNCIMPSSYFAHFRKTE